MHDIDYWKRLGFRFESRFPGEYDLWINSKTFQYLRRYVNGQEWLQDLNTGKYELASPPRSPLRTEDKMNRIVRIEIDHCLRCPHSGQDINTTRTIRRVGK
jgi:hypothetical protein